MPSMTKRVNVYAQVAVRNVTPPIHGTCKDIIMTTGDILKCLCKRARVEEIMPDGKTIRLNMSNYYTDNGAGLDASKSVTKEVKKVEESARFKVPVAPRAQVVETKTFEEPKHEIVINETQTDFASKIEEPTISLPIKHLENDAEPENKVDIVTEDAVGGIIGMAEANAEISNCANLEGDEDSAPVVENVTNSTNNNQNHHNHNKKKHKK